MSLVKRLLVGRPLASAEALHQRLSKKVALAVFSADAVASSAFATEEILHVLVPVAGMAALDRLLPISALVVLLLAIVVSSYRQTIASYPDERYLDMERDAWIVLAAQAPERMEEVIAGKHAELDDPDAVQLYLLLSQALDWPPDHPRIVEVADLLERLIDRAFTQGDLGTDGFDDRVVELLDAMTAESSPVARRLLAILQARGWTGWTRIERADGVSAPSSPGRSPRR